MQPMTILSQTGLPVIIIFAVIFSTIHGYAQCKKNTFRAFLVRNTNACNGMTPVILNLS